MSAITPSAAHGSAAPDLSIIIVTWNSLEVTAACLESLREMTRGVRYEVIVIDNGSRDATPSELPRRFPWMRFIANATNTGFTRANNQGIREARGRYVLLLNSDTIQTMDAPSEAVRYMDAHPEVGALGIMHRNNDAERTFQPSCYPFPRPWADTLTLLGLVRESAGPADPGSSAFAAALTERDVDWVCGSFLLVRRELFDRVGLLDERYFAYCEDIDWCRTARLAGYVVRFWPGASMIHLGSVSGSRLRDKTGLMFRSQITYLRKNHGILPAAAFYLVMNLRLCLAFAGQVVKQLAGRATQAEVGERWTRLTNFIALRAHSS